MYYLWLLAAALTAVRVPISTLLFACRYCRYIGRYLLTIDVRLPIIINRVDTIMIQLSMLPIQVTIIIAGLLFSSHYTHHHVHGVHVDGVYCGSAISVCPSPSAFQYCKQPFSSIISSGRSSLTRLKYSSDEDESGGSGVISWLQQPTTQKQPLLLSDEVLHSSTDNNVDSINRWDCIDRDLS